MPDRKITVTDEMVDSAREAYGKARGVDPRVWFRAAITAALDAAPTTDPAHDIDWQEVAERHEDTIKTLIAERDEADRRTAEAEEQRDQWKRHYDRVDGQWAKAEREVTKLRADVERPQSVTAREHLDASWEAAYVPEDGIIPAGADHLLRDPDGFLGVDRADHAMPQSNEGVERRLLDPPTPKRPDGAEEIEALIREANREGDGVADKLADRLASRGVRVTEDEGSTR